MKFQLFKNNNIGKHINSHGDKSRSCIKNSDSNLHLLKQILHSYQNNPSKNKCNRNKV